MDYQPPPFFSRGPAPLVRLGFFACLAVLLMVLDARFRYAESLRQVVALLAYPLQRAALAPAELFGAAGGFFTTQVSLKQENEQLKAKQLLAANDLLTVDALRAENAQLRRLLEARERLPRPSTLAEILYQGRDPFSRKVIIDKGSRQGHPVGTGGYRRHRRRRTGDARISAALRSDPDHGQGAANTGAGFEERLARRHLRRR